MTEKETYFKLKYGSTSREFFIKLQEQDIDIFDTRYSNVVKYWKLVDLETEYDTETDKKNI